MRPRAPAATPESTAVGTGPPAVDDDVLGMLALEPVLGTLLAPLIMPDVIVEPALLVRIVVIGPVAEPLLIIN